ncbi:hypothetical protein CPC16_000606 [Podila verticillata]|nr:hypothetical protein BGZ52_011894 [Haplosporangium bisporale]KAF9216522.1 hypothetical protein BGZ59_009327 [Podila verticillata]KAF9375630.1 hypothetical protein CPC16_000606 [Podila verticillata]
MSRSTKKVSSSLSCRYCDRKFSRSNNRTKHEMYIHYHQVHTEYRCIWKHCFKPFKRKGDLARHIREYHLDLHYRFECNCPSQGDPRLSGGHSRSSSDTSSRARSRAPSGEPLFYKREAGSAARLCGCDPQGTPVYPWHQNADPLRRRAWDWDEIFENWDMVQWASLSPELCGELELLVIQELARTVSVGQGEEEDEEGPV